MMNKPTGKGKGGDHLPRILRVPRFSIGIYVRSDSVLEIL